MRRFIVVLGLLASALAHAQPARDSSNDLLRKCNVALRAIDGNSPVDLGQKYDVFSCIGYVSGYRDAVANAQFLKPACIPTAATSGQLLRVIVKHLQEHPQSLHLDASLGIHAALLHAFPCK
jgi:hypothetical protein